MSKKLEAALAALDERLTRIENIVTALYGRIAADEFKAINDAVDTVNLSFIGLNEKPPAQVLEAIGSDESQVMRPSTMPPDLERRLAIVGDERFQKFCQTACDHGIDEGEPPIKQAARVILSVCCVSTPYALVEPEPAERLKALFERFERWVDAQPA